MTDETRTPAAARAPLLSVQALRALAALSVMLHHAGHDADSLAARFGRPPLGLERAFDLSFGIHLFFVISGFIMVRTARGFGQPGAPRRFLGRRLLRIAPLYWVMTTLVIAGGLAAPGLLNSPLDGWPLILGSYLFVPVMRSTGEVSPVLGQGWTLNYEMAFYVLFAASMVLPRRWGLAAVAAAIAGLAFAGWLFTPRSATGFVWTNALLLEFLLGIAVGLVVEAGLRLRTAPSLALGAAGLVLAVVLNPGEGSIATPDLWLRAGMPAAVILLGCVASPPWRAETTTVIGRLVLALAILGDASYSLYLSHPFAIRLLRVGWAASIGSSAPIWLFLPGACVLAIGLGLVVFRFVERPMTERLNQLFPAVRHLGPEQAIEPATDAARRPSGTAPV